MCHGPLPIDRYNRFLSIYRLTTPGIPGPPKSLSKIESQVYKTAKAHDVYHRCLCFIFDQTTMAQEQKFRTVCWFRGEALKVSKLPFD